MIEVEMERYSTKGVYLKDENDEHANFLAKSQASPGA
jgi:hypothetical protein